jgi:hypothetical protein
MKWEGSDWMVGTARANRAGGITEAIAREGSVKENLTGDFKKLLAPRHLTDILSAYK